MFGKKAKEIQVKSAAHWQRMIDWAKTQDPSDLVNRYSMKNAIGEVWYADDCAHCEAYHCEGNLLKSWSRCPLNPFKFFRKRYIRCCDGLWNEVNISWDWETWIRAAEKVLEYIRENG